MGAVKPTSQGWCEDYLVNVGEALQDFNIKSTAGLWWWWAEQDKTMPHVTFPLSPCSPAERGRQAGLQLGFSRRTSTTHSRLHAKLLGSAFLHPLKWSTLPWESIQGSRLRSQGFSTVLLGHGVGESRDGKSTWIIRCIPKSSCHRHPCVLFSHPKSCLVGKLPRKGSAHSRPSRSGTSDRNNGVSFPRKKYTFC